jgi:hypothetical protein
VRIFIGWRERRQALRSFRIDRVVGTDFRQERYPAGPLHYARNGSLPYQRILLKSDLSGGATARNR